MKKMNLLKSNLLVMAVLGSLNAYAQYDVGADVDSELNQAYQTQQAPLGGSYAPKGAVRSQQQQPIYIVNQQQPQQQVIQKQPTTVIEASPLTESNAERIRKARQDAELQTEQKIVEKLETSRMEDEKRRANVLFGDKFDTLNNQNTQQQAPPPPVAAPTPVIINQVAPPEENTRDVVREEIKAALESEKTIPEKPMSQKYFGALMGMNDVPEAKNVKGNYALGFMIGSRHQSGLVIEGGFTYATYEIERQYQDAYGVVFPRYIDATQYSGSVAAKFELSNAMFRPFVGGLAQYSYREYVFSTNQVYSYAKDQNASATSTAIDLGLTAGLDLAVSEQMSLGLDFRYLFNVTNQSETKRSVYYENQEVYGTKLEKMNYYIIGLTGKYTF